MRYTQGQGVISEDIPSIPSKRMLKKSFWSREEDEKLANYIRNNGNLGGWSYVAKQAGKYPCLLLNFFIFYSILFNYKQCNARAFRST